MQPALLLGGKKEKMSRGCEDWAEQSRKAVSNKKAQLPDSKKRKRRGLGTKLLQLFACGLKGDLSSEIENTFVQPEVTVAQIREHIEHSRLLNASKDLIVLEHKVYSKTYGKSESEARKDQQELEELYQQLEKDVFRIVEESIASCDPDLLQQAAEAVTEQENEDQKYLSARVPPTMNNARPRKWKTMWRDAVNHSVKERIKINEASPTNKMSFIATLLLHLGKTFRDDLTHVVTHLRQHYADDFDVCNTYAGFYFESFCEQLKTFTEFELSDEDTYLILSWVESIYPNEILNHFSLESGVDVDKLRHLLPSQSIRKLEYYYIINEEATVEKWMQKSLDMEVDKWKEARKPETLNDCFHSELPIDILQTIYSAKERAGRLSGDLSRLLMHALSPKLSNLLKSYKEAFEEFSVQHTQNNYFKSIIMVNINSCQTFREGIETLQSPVYNGCLSILGDVENAGYEVLLEDLFQNLKSYFKQFSQRNGLCSYQTMEGIIKITMDYLSELTMLKETCYKDVVERTHFHLVKEYIARLMRKKVSKRIPDELQSMASQICNNSKLIEDCCSSHGSRAAWLNPVIPSLAEIIKLQDTIAIQIEVASLARKYPDITKKHIASILYIKGNLTNADVRAIQDILDHCERSTDASCPKLFSYVN